MPREDEVYIGKCLDVLLEEKEVNFVEEFERNNQKMVKMNKSKYADMKERLSHLVEFPCNDWFMILHTINYFFNNLTYEFKNIFSWSTDASQSPNNKPTIKRKCWNPYV